MILLIKYKEYLFLNDVLDAFVVEIKLYQRSGISKFRCPSIIVILTAATESGYPRLVSLVHPERIAVLDRTPLGRLALTWLAADHHNIAELIQDLLAAVQFDFLGLQVPAPVAVPLVVGDVVVLPAAAVVGVDGLGKVFVLGMR